ncbi:hypothetical protein HZ326_20530 [Fusarium oxysporum f. sp. albedinis]|nr:hypothetical protein HZ326_20530 [Fusarium oxysporum f. sp. albedinis]
MTWAANETYTRWLLPLASTGGNGLPNLHRSGPCFSFLVLLSTMPQPPLQIKISDLQPSDDVCENHGPALSQRWSTALARCKERIIMIYSSLPEILPIQRPRILSKWIFVGHAFVVNVDLASDKAKPLGRNRQCRADSPEDRCN